MISKNLFYKSVLSNNSGWFYPILQLVIGLLILSTSLACQKLANDEIPVEEFLFSKDISLAPSERRADSTLNILRNELVLRKGKSWQLFTSFNNSIAGTKDEKLYKLFKKMPKGGLLHVHASATGDADWIV